MYGRFGKPVEIVAAGIGENHTGELLFFGTSGRNSPALGTAYTAERKRRMDSLYGKKRQEKTCFFKL